MKRDIKNERKFHLELLHRLEITDEIKPEIKRLKEFLELPEIEELKRGGEGSFGPFICHYGPTFWELDIAKIELEKEKEALGMTALKLGEQYTEVETSGVVQISDTELIQNLKREVKDLTELLTTMMTQKNQEHASFTSISNQRILFSVVSDKRKNAAVSTQTTERELNETEICGNVTDLGSCSGVFVKSESNT